MFESFKQFDGQNQDPTEALDEDDFLERTLVESSAQNEADIIHPEKQGHNEAQNVITKVAEEGKPKNEGVQPEVLDEFEFKKQDEAEPSKKDDDASSMNFDNEDLEDPATHIKQFVDYERTSDRRTGSIKDKKKAENAMADPDFNRIEMKRRKRQQTTLDHTAKEFGVDEDDDHDSGTEIGHDNGNKLLDDDQSDKVGAGRKQQETSPTMNG